MEDDFEIFFWKRHREKERVTVLESKYTNTFRKEFVLEIPVLLQIFIRNSGFSLGPLFVVRVSVVKFTAPFSSPSPVSYTERGNTSFVLFSVFLLPMFSSLCNIFDAGKVLLSCFWWLVVHTQF